LAGETVTFDALFTQTTIAQQVVEQGGAYLMMVKGNQRWLLASVEAATADHPRRPVRRLGHALGAPGPQEKVFKGCPGGGDGTDPELNRLKNRVDETA
jgi:hypothetical protein